MLLIISVINLLYNTVKNLVFILTGGEEDKLVQHSAEVTFYDYSHITLLHCCL